MLTHWTRDRTRGEKLPLEWVIRAQTHDTASLVGLNDRGLLKPGYKADLNIINYDQLTLHRPSVAYDLPAGGRRLVQKADGYDATIVSGQVTYREGKPLAALPGKLIRGAQASPG
jgi:N-acyl-D-aspartate/D-glutamate deacylase